SSDQAHARAGTYQELGFTLSNDSAADHQHQAPGYAQAYRQQVHRLGPEDGGGAVHVSAQSLGHRDAAILVLIVLEHGHQGTANSETGTIDGVQEFRLAGDGIAPTCLHATRLEVTEVAARGNLAVGVLARQPHFEIVGLARGEADVTTAENDD